MASERALTLGLAAKTFGQSLAKSYLGLSDPLLIALIDEAVAMRLLEREVTPDAAKYASEADYDDADEMKMA